jgi:transaldolase/glucose-6-phosphate isomerase
MELSALPTEINEAIDQEIEDWESQGKVYLLWDGDASLWTNNDEADWIGWLTHSIQSLPDLIQIESLTEEIKGRGFKDIVLLGMGGSSLCPDVMSKTFGKVDDYPYLRVLDSTDPEQILKLEKSINLKKTFFIVSSKSGTTLEPNILKQYFYARLQATLNRQAVGEYFMAITDPGTQLETVAKKEYFKSVSYGVPSIGGRYSALSNFGMLPSGLMGLAVKEILLQAEKMATACLPYVPIRENPGVMLGIYLGVLAKYGKDKITLIISPEINNLGAWLEQLLAESTGKNGKGLIPIDLEPLGFPDVYSNDRVFIYIALKGHADNEQENIVHALEQSGHVVIRIPVSSKKHMGAEFFRWEVATSVAGSIIGINPFNQPNVEASKARAIALTAEFERTGKIPQPKQLISSGGLQLLTDEENADMIHQQHKGPPSIVDYLAAHFRRIKPGDYFNLSAFIEHSDENFRVLQKIRELIRDNKKVATCLGFGPRFLHSTGQLYKGGPNSGIFLQITTDHPEDILVPGHRYTFGTVINAQAQADFEMLSARSRRILRVHLRREVTKHLQILLELTRQALYETK